MTNMTTTRSALSRLGLISILCLAAMMASAATITVTDPGAIYSTPKVACKRGDASDKCWVEAWITTGKGAERDSSTAIYGAAFDNWKKNNKGWKVEDKGPLKGDFKIDLFRAYNDCPKNGGVEINATFTPKGKDPVIWAWSQGIYAPPTNSPHAGPVVASQAYMDCNVLFGTRDEEPPLYPYSYLDQRFYDRPGRACVHSSTVSWTGVCLLSMRNAGKKTLYTWQGFEYGFNVKCEHTPVPEPVSLAGLGIGALALLRRRKQVR